MKASESSGARQGTGKRPYNSATRQAAARATRAAVIAAAQGLFEKNGYAGTTLAGVAEAAHVSLATVKLTAPTKAALLVEVAYAAARGDATATSLAERPDWAAILTAPTPEAVIDRWAALATAAHERQAAILEVVWQAASADAGVAAAARDGRKSRRADFERIIDELESRGRLRPDKPTALDIAWALNSPELYRLFASAGWSSARWQRWLEETLKAQLLTPAAGSPPR